MASVAILIPWRSGCPYRERALDHIIGLYASEHPDWQLVVGECPSGPWIKALAVADSLTWTTATILVIADADCWADGLSGAVRRVQDGARWAIGHRWVHRLTEASTGLYVAGADWRGLPLVGRSHRGIEEGGKPYEGIEGGGITIMRRDVYEDCPIDPRFAEWGSEDEAWGWALRTLHGRPWHGHAPLVHLYHPPEPRMTRARGTEANWGLRKRYAHAYRNPEAMRKLIGEVTHDPRNAVESARHDRQPIRR